MDNVIVTGATGPLGLALCEYLDRLNISVFAIVRPNSARKKYLPSRVRVFERDLDNLLSLNVKADAFFHLGWSTETRETVADPIPQAKNIFQTINAVRLAQYSKCKVFVGAGSWVEHGYVTRPITPDTMESPQSAYGIAKYAAGKLSRTLCQRYGIRHCWARILSIYGPYDKDTTAFVYFINCLLKGEKPLLTEGSQTWDFIYSADCAKAMYLIAEKGKDGAIYPVGTGYAPPIREYFEYIRDRISPCMPLVFGERPYAKNQVMLLCADITELYKDTGFEPDYSFEEGIEKMIEWREHDFNNNASV